MPVYNAAPYLESCLDSIIDQTYQQWELIAVNDFSTDVSPKILAKYAKKDKRIIILNNSQKGIIHALRNAFKVSRGTYITRMDADDLMPPEKLAKLLQQLSEAGIGHIATGKVKYFSDQTLGAGYKRYEAWINQQMESGHLYRGIYQECVIPSPCWLIHRQDLERCEAFTPSTYPEDYDLCFRFYKYRMIPKPVVETMHYWRDHSNRATRNDDNYSNPNFLSLKLKYFLELEVREETALILWGAGKKGKFIARKLMHYHQPFSWVCENQRKVGLEIYGKTLDSPKSLEYSDRLKIIIAVSNPEEQKIIKAKLTSEKLKLGAQFFFFS